MGLAVVDSVYIAAKTAINKPARQIDMLIMRTALIFIVLHLSFVCNESVVSHFNYDPFCRL